MTEGERVDFDPAALGAFADSDAETGNAVTCVFGLAVGAVPSTREGDQFCAVDWPSTRSSTHARRTPAFSSCRSAAVRAVAT